MNDFQFIKVNEDSTIKVEYRTTNYTNISNPDGLTGQELIAFVSEKITELSADDVFINPEIDILKTLGIEHTIPEIPELVIMEIVETVLPTTE
jgi:hypothetical protein